MKARICYVAVTLLAVAGLLASSTRVAHAYVDPGTGLLVYQSMTAFVTGLMFYFRRRIKLLLFKNRSDPEKP